MKKFLFVAIMAIVSLAVNAEKQEDGTVSLMPHVGFGYAHLSNTDRCSNGAGVVVGGEMQYMCTDDFGLSAGLDYNYIQSGKEAYNNVSDVYITTNVINIPLLAQLHFGDYFAVKAGVQPSFLIDPRLHGTAREAILGVDQKISDFTNNFQLSIPVGFSVELNQPVVFDLRANIPVTKVLDGGKIKDLATNVSMFTVMFTVGYRFDLE